MYTLHFEEGRRLELPGRTVTVLVGNEKMQSDLMTFGVTEVPPKSRMDPHNHVQEEIIYIMQGYGEVVINGQAEELKPGTVIKLVDDCEHYIENKSDETMRFTFCFHPTVQVGSYDSKDE